MGNWKKVDKLLNGTSKLPRMYGRGIIGIFVAGTERTKLRRIRETTEDYELSLKKGLVKKQIGKGAIEGVAKAFRLRIKDLGKVCESIQLAEMRLVDRFNEVGRSLIRFKVPELKEIDRFVGIGGGIKNLTYENWELITAVLKDAPPRKPMLLKAKAFAKLGESKMGLARDIEEWDREVYDYVATQKSTLRTIGKLIEKIGKDDEARKNFELALNKFGSAAESELKIISEMIMNVLILFTKSGDWIEYLTTEKGGKYPKNSEGYKSILEKFLEVGETLSVMAKDTTFTIAGHGR